jgi:hypothetical protein
MHDKGRAGVDVPVNKTVSFTQHDAIINNIFIFAQFIIEQAAGGR